MEEKGLKVTFSGISVSNGTPLTVSFPFDRSKMFSRVSEGRKPNVGVTGPFGGAMTK